MCVQTKNHSFHAVTNHWCLLPLQADSYLLQLSADCALLVPVDSSCQTRRWPPSFFFLLLVRIQKKAWQKGTRWEGNLRLLSAEVRRQWGWGGKGKRTGKKYFKREKQRRRANEKMLVISAKEEMCKICMCKKLVKDYWVENKGICWRRNSWQLLIWVF